MSCKNCYWCHVSFSGNRVWMCKLSPEKKFNRRLLHGWFCKYRHYLEGRRNEEGE